MMDGDFQLTIISNQNIENIDTLSPLSVGFLFEKVLIHNFTK